MNVSDRTNYRKLFDKKNIERLLSNTGVTDSLTLNGLSLSANGQCFYTWGKLSKSVQSYSLQFADHLISVELDVNKNPEAALELVKFTLSSNLQKSLLATETLDRYKEINSLFMDFNLKSPAFLPKSHTGVLVRVIMYYKLINNTLQQYYDLRF